MGFHLYKMGIKGKVAVANMWLVFCALGVIAISNSNQSQQWRAASDVAEIALAVLSCPVGWVALILGFDLGTPDLMSFVAPAILLPMNAYFWGSIVETLVEGRKARKARKGKTD